MKICRETHSLYSRGMDKLPVFAWMLVLCIFSTVAAAQGTKTVKNPDEPTSAEKAHIPPTSSTTAPQSASDSTVNSESAAGKMIEENEQESTGDDPDADQPAARSAYHKIGRTALGES